MTLPRRSFLKGAGALACVGVSLGELGCSNGGTTGNGVPPYVEKDWYTSLSQEEQDAIAQFPPLLFRSLAEEADTYGDVWDLLQERVYPEMKDGVVTVNGESYKLAEGGGFQHTDKSGNAQRLPEKIFFYPEAYREGIQRMKEDGDPFYQTTLFLADVVQGHQISTDFVYRVVMNVPVNPSESERVLYIQVDDTDQDGKLDSIHSIEEAPLSEY